MTVLHQTSCTYLISPVKLRVNISALRSNILDYTQFPAIALLRLIALWCLRLESVSKVIKISLR